MRNTRDHACKKPAVGLGLIGLPLDGSEAKGIHEEHRARAHGENIADDPADSRGRTLKRLNRTRMIVALNLKSNSPSVTNINDPGILLTCLH